MVIPFQNHYDFYNTDKRREPTEKEYYLYFKHMINSLRAINPVDIHHKQNLSYEKIEKILGDILMTILFYHNQKDTFYWSRSRRMWEYTLRSRKKLGIDNFIYDEV